MFTMKLKRENGRLKITYWKNKEFERIFNTSEKTTGKYGGLTFSYSRRSQVVTEVQTLLRSKGYGDSLEGDD